jgi:hypothetical protein
MTSRRLDLGAMLAAIEGWLAMTNRPPPDVEDGSPLAGDARKSPKLQVAHAAWNGVTHAVDHLHALKALIADAQVVHPYAPFTLLRAATENAATAVWLLAPRRRSERLQRRLRLAHNEAREAGEVEKLIPPERHGKRSAQERIDEIRSLASALGLDLSYVCGRFSYENIVKDAGETALLGADLSALLWRLGAGFSHGRYWASFSMLERQEVATDAADVVNVRLTTSVDQVMTVAQAPFLLTDKAVALYEQRRRGPGDS